MLAEGVLVVGAPAEVVAGGASLGGALALKGITAAARAGAIATLAREAPAGGAPGGLPAATAAAENAPTRGVIAGGGIGGWAVVWSAVAAEEVAEGTIVGVSGAVGTISAGEVVLGPIIVKALLVAGTLAVR